MNLKSQLFLLFSLFLLLFMDPITFFGTIHFFSLYYISYLLILFTIFSTKKFQFQLNKLFLNQP